MRNEPKVEYDGVADFLGGMDSGRTASALRSNQVAFAINVTFRGGHADQRPGWPTHALEFSNDEVRDAYENGLLQGAHPFRDTLIVSVSGRLFQIDPLRNYEVRELTPFYTIEISGATVSPPLGATVNVMLVNVDEVQLGQVVRINDGTYTVAAIAGLTLTLTNIDATPGVVIPTGAVASFHDLNMPQAPTVWMEQVEGWLVIQDGKSPAIIYNGSRARRANRDKDEVPTGKQMAYGNGRLWVAVNDRGFIAGDINNGPSTPIQFTENALLTGGGSFRLPGDNGDITGMKFMQTLDESLAQGPLLVFSEDGIYAVNVPVNRDEWQSLTYPAVTTVQKGFGAMGQDSIQVLNGDIFYRARDGVRSFILARREFGSWGNVPISSEMHRVIRDDPQPLMAYVSACIFDNRMLFTTSLQIDRYNALGKALGVLDFHTVSGMGSKAPPVWDGFWTGLNVKKLVTMRLAGQERCFAFVVVDGKNQLWEISKSEIYDGDTCRIQSVVETRSHSFSSIFAARRLEGLELWIDELKGDVGWDVKFRSDRYPCWRDWATWTDCQSVTDCPEGDCWMPVVKRPGYRTRRSLPLPPEDCDGSDNKGSDVGFEHQVRISWTGRVRLQKYMVKAAIYEEDPKGNLVC